MVDANSSLQITIDVVDSSGSVQTINATTAAVQHLGAAGTKAGADLGAIGAGPVKSAITGLGTSANAASQAFVGAGTAAETMASAVGSGMQQVSGHTLTALDNVRLLRDDLGIHIPRGMESAIARSEVLSKAIGGLGAGLVGLGAVEIFVRLGTQIYDAYEKTISLKAAAKEYQDQLGKRQEEDFTNTRAIEDTADRWNLATRAAAAYHDEAEKASTLSYRVGTDPKQSVLSSSLGVAGMVAAAYQRLTAAHDNEVLSGQSQAQADALARRNLQQQHELTDAQIEAAHAGDSALQGQQKISAELAKQLALHKEEQSFSKNQDQLDGNIVGDNSGGAVRAVADQAAQAQAAAQTIELQRQIRDKTIELQDQARNAGLEGNALYRAQEEEAIAAVQRSATGTAAQIAAIREKYHNEELKRLQAETDEVNKRARAEEEAGLTGLAKIQAQGQDRLSEIDQKQARGGYASASDANKDRQTAHDATLREMNDAEKQYNEQVQAFADQTAGKMVTGYAKIDQQRDASVNKLQDDFTKVYGQLDAQNARYQDGQAALAKGVVAVNEQADRERVELHAKTMNDIEATEVQAARIAQSENKTATGEIVDEYNRRLAQAQATLHQQLAANHLSADDQALVWQEYYARIKADADLAGAQMEKSAQETRDKVADSLSSLFSDPAGFLEKRAKETMYKVLANGILSATNNLQGKGGEALASILGLGPDLKAPTGSGGGFGAILGLSKTTGTADAGTQLTTASTALTNAGTGLTTAGTTLTNAGTGITTASATLSNTGSVLTSAGTALDSAAQALQSAASALQSSGGSTGGGFGIGDSSGDDSGGGGGGADDSGSAGVSSGSLSAALHANSPATGAEAATGIVGKAAGGSSTAVGAIAGAAGAGIAGGLGIVSAYKNSDPLAGAVSGGTAGAAIGGLFGPVGTVVGAAIGAIGGLIAGLFGDHGKAKAEAYDTGTVAPALASELANFDSGQTGYTQASRDLINLRNQAQQATQSMGSGARAYFTNNITPEIAAVQAKIDAEEKAGRNRLTFSAAQFHSGGPITGFGDLATSGTEGYIHALMGERVMNPQASSTHGPLLDAMNAGYSPTSVLSGQMKAAVSSIAGGSTTRLGASGGGNNVSMSVSAIDAQSFARFLRTGGGKVIQQHLNAAPGTYGGKADG